MIRREIMSIVKEKDIWWDENNEESRDKQMNHINTKLNK